MLTSRVTLKNTKFHEKILNGIQKTEGHTPKCGSKNNSK